MTVHAPRIASRLERRLLVNYRLDPEATARVLPAGMRPEVVNGYAVGGICLVRIGRVRPAGVPERFGLRSENAAHRIAVTWDGPNGAAGRGVYILRRDTDSALVGLAGGRVFPGEHHRADFAVREDEHEVSVASRSRDHGTDVSVRASIADEWPGSSLFADLAAASRFFREAPVAYSARSAGRTLDGLELRAEEWRIASASVLDVRSSFFDDRDRFPAGTAAIDCALLMRDVPVTWEPRSSWTPQAESRTAQTA